MLGGHLDSWHAATGATDNAIGCAVVMEAVRVLKAIGVKPRRTIRVALWSGEEQGLRGSRAYIRQQFGTFEEPKPAFRQVRRLREYRFRHGTGALDDRLRSRRPQRRSVREAIAPFKDLGVLGATNTRSRQGGSSDHAAFNEAGLPGINVLQDPIEYDSAHVAQQSRYLRADRRRRRDQVRHRCGGDGLSPRDAPRPVAAILAGGDAAPARAEMKPEIQQLLAILDQAYNRTSWHGTNLRGSIRRVSAGQAAWRPGPKRHNIWETVVHAAYWKYAVARRFTGGDRGSFPLKGSNWFSRPIDTSARDRGGVAGRCCAPRSNARHAQNAAMMRLSLRDLPRTPAGKKVSNFALLVRGRRARPLSRRTDSTIETPHASYGATKVALTSL